jgi:diguanylate cyclase (GGDEF)-like protein/PAS domain S-box-containing protein
VTPDQQRDALSLTLVVQIPGLVCVFASPTSAAVLGQEAHEVIGQSVLLLAHPDDRERLQDAITGLAGTQQTDMLHVRLLDEAGESAWFELQLHGREDDSDEVVLLIRDANDREATPIGDVVAAHHDPLTGAVTRPLLLDHAQQALLRLEREDLYVALLFLDLDHLKPINDTLGHHVGDEVLRELVRRVSGLLRPVDTLARLGGDEFAVLVGDLKDPAAARKLANRIVNLSRTPFEVEGHQVDCSVSVGLTLSSDHTQTTETLLRQADVAMYQAKASGGGAWRAWGLHDEQRINEQHRIGALLGEAVLTHSIVLDYQPVVRLVDEAEIGNEVLLRVVDRDGRVLRPPAFLDVAVSQQLIGALDLEVLRQAIVEQHARPRTLPIDLNLAAIDLEDIAWIDVAEDKLAHDPNSFGRLHVELREELLRNLTPAAVQRLHDLRARGVRVGLDSFGSGVSALSTLWSYPLDYVKLHPSITAQLPTVRSARALARAIAELAHGLGLLVIANGVENEEQRTLALLAGCDYGQGFLWPAHSTHWASDGPDGQHPYNGSDAAGSF